MSAAGGATTIGQHTNPTFPPAPGAGSGSLRVPAGSPPGGRYDRGEGAEGSTCFPGHPVGPHSSRRGQPRSLPPTETLVRTDSNVVRTPPTPAGRRSARRPAPRSTSPRRPLGVPSTCSTGALQGSSATPDTPSRPTASPSRVGAPSARDPDGIASIETTVSHQLPGPASSSGLPTSQPSLLPGTDCYRTL